MENKTDLRVLRTRKVIREAFLTLLEEKRYEHVTIQDIAKEAFINRNTFYLHYSDKEDLFQKLSLECLTELKNSLSANMLEADVIRGNGLYPVLERVFESIGNHIWFYKLAMSDNWIPCFTEQLKETIRNHISMGVKQFSASDEAKEKLRSIYIDYMVSGLVGVIAFWLKNGDRYSVKEMTDALFNIHANSFLENIVKG